MRDTEPTEVTQSQQGGLLALVEASQDRDILADYRTIANAFDDEDYRTIIDLAWRHQFDNERLHFKREIRELQQYVCSRIQPTRSL